MSAKKKSTAPQAPDAELDAVDEFAAAAAGADEFTEAPSRKAKAFWPSAKRLLGLMAPYKLGMVMVFALITVFVVLSVIAPRVLGKAMDVIFGGLIGKNLQVPAGTSNEQIIEGLRAAGQDTQADMLSKVDFVPGQGIDFIQLSHYILIVLSMYFIASLFSWASGWLLNRIVMRVVYKLRSDVEDKLNRLPLNYFDTRQRGDILSRVTNDVDNIQNALQQALSQLVQSVMTVLGIVFMMFLVSWQMALIALVALPLSGIAAGVIGSKAQKKFAAQWKNTGALNGQIEESFSGHELMKIFGREEDMVARFTERNESLYKAAFGAQALSMSMMPRVPTPAAAR